jgi:hypothetical protein
VGRLHGLRMPVAELEEELLQAGVVRSALPAAA